MNRDFDTWKEMRTVTVPESTGTFQTRGRHERRRAGHLGYGQL